MKCIGIDVGGSHVSASVIELSQEVKQSLHFHRKEINSLGTADSIIEAISSCIKEVATDMNNVEAVGLAFPGPFDYPKGVSTITGVGGKFEKTFGLHVAQALKTSTGLHHVPFAFANDAHCFALGAYSRYALTSKRTVFLTLGTGFGSAFMENALLQINHPLIPATGTFYDQPFIDKTAEDYISTRWLLQEYNQRKGIDIASVKELASEDSDISRSIFHQFGTNLGNFLLPWLTKYKCDELVIGGNIAKANGLFHTAMIKELELLGNSIHIIYCNDTDECILTGAAVIAGDQLTLKQTNNVQHDLRKTTQYLLPLSTTDGNGKGYNVFPSYRSGRTVYNGFHSLAKKISQEKTVVIDGFGGVLWENFRKQLQAALQATNKKVFWYNLDSCLHAPEKINNILVDSLNGDDPVFGKRYNGSLIDFFDEEKLKLIQPDEAADLCILYGTGAALSNWKGLLVYLDVPKNEIQYRMRAGTANNIGAVTRTINSQTYKRFYFVDWPVLNKHKEQLLPQIDCIVDEQRISEITWMEGDDFRSALNEMLSHSLRARPWFEAGIWGGHWMKNKIAGLNQEEINYAWSFELITPENGIVLDGATYLLEVSFDYLLFMNNKSLLGKAAQRFGNEFPIRFDFLDTYDGGNLSIQCHPRTKYIQEKFGENFTQDETYYILDCEPDAKVYLGFQEDIEPTALKTALMDAQEKGIEMPVEKFVQIHDAKKHDLFLIPNGTIHASGKNNLVLEISNTPYIFTFKMYDWLRLDLNGQPRPINIEHAFNNLYFDRKGEYVEQQLISHPFVEQEWENGKKWKLPTHQEHFYTIDRYEFSGELTITTNDQCHCCMLVEGTEVEVVTGNKTDVFAYAETFIVPASVNTYTVRSTGEEKAFLVVAYVKDDCC
jgi:predicted NBD/HSP70 family sugar kinase/mannose-6-phosphate isomerase class I